MDSPTKARHPIAPAIRVAIMEKLARVERDENVKIVLAVESGSRAWGFASPDSDYDVRFIYVRRLADYLTLAPRRDVLELPIDATFDINGWDLRKALGLLTRSNPMLIEWFSSPVRYLAVSPWVEQLVQQAIVAIDPRALRYHYINQTRLRWDQISHSDPLVSVKHYCYGLRCALALDWLDNHQGLLPMDVASLVADLSLQPALLADMAQLLATKASAHEKGRTARHPLIDAYLQAMLEKPRASRKAQSRTALSAQGDALFAKIVMALEGSAH